MCVDLGQIPRKVILGRFNFQSPLGKRCAWMGGWGDWVEPYTYTVGEDGYYTLSHNVEVMQHFYERARKINRFEISCRESARER